MTAAKWFLLYVAAGFLVCVVAPHAAFAVLAARGGGGGFDSARTADGYGSFSGGGDVCRIVIAGPWEVDIKPSADGGISVRWESFGAGDVSAGVVGDALLLQASPKSPHYTENIRGAEFGGRLRGDFARAEVRMPSLCGLYATAGGEFNSGSFPKSARFAGFGGAKLTVQIHMTAGGLIAGEDSQYDELFLWLRSGGYEFDADLSGVRARDAEFTAGGGGVVFLNVADGGTLSGEAGGGVRVEYSGNPAEVKTEEQHTGQIRKAGL